MSKTIQRLSPLTEATLYTLLALTEPLHGYGIIKKVEILTKGRLTLAAGTLYGVLQSLTQHKLIILHSEEGTTKKKKIYCITELGIELINFEYKRISQLHSNLKEGVQLHGKNS